MSRRVLLTLLCLVLLAFAVLLLLNQLGTGPFQILFPSANREENPLVPQEGASGVILDGEASDAESLPGNYTLTAAETSGLTLSAEMLSAIRRIGVPLELEVFSDRTAVLRIFDRSWSMNCEPEAMLFRHNGEAIPFSLQDGTLTLWDDEIRLVFEKAG